MSELSEWLNDVRTAPRVGGGFYLVSVDEYVLRRAAIDGQPSPEVEARWREDYERLLVPMRATGVVRCISDREWGAVIKARRASLDRMPDLS